MPATCLAIGRVSTMRRLWRACAIGLVAGGLGGLLALTPLGVALEERFGLSWLFWVRGPLPPPADTVVVSLDRESAELRQLPEKISDWPRDVHARLIERLAAAGASAIAFDVRFNERREPKHDRALAQAIAAAGRVVLFEQLHEDFRLLPGGDGAVAGLLAAKQWRPPLPELVAAAVATAPFPLPRTTDRVSRFWAFTAGLDERPTLPVVALQHHAMPVLADWTRLLRAAGVPVGQGDLVLEPEHLARPGALPAAMRALRLAFGADPGLGTRLRADLARARLDQDARRLLAALIDLYDGPDSRYLNFYGPAGRVPTIPLHRLLAAADPEEAAPDLAGKAVLVGQSELINLSDDSFITVFAGPKGAHISGVEIAATALANLLDDRLLQPAGLMPTLLWVGGFGLVVSLIAGLLPALVALPLALAFVAAWYLGAQIAFTQADFWLPVTIPLLIQLPLGLFAGLLLQYRDARRARANISRGMRYYLPERIAAGFAENPLDPSTLKERLFAACLISDSQGFTALGEGMSPEALSAFLDRYFAILFGTVERYGGVVTDVIGDGMTCVWTAPQVDPGCCRRACLAAVDIAREVAEFNRTEPFALPTRFGLNAGFVMVGNVGGSGRFVYSVVGDCANTASRLESLNKQLGTRILASDAVTGELTGLLLRPLGRFLVVGRTQPLGIAEVVGRADDPHDPALLAAFAEALASFQAHRWGEAAARFEALLAEHPGDGPAWFYLDRCRRYLAGAPLPPDPGLIRLERK
jgi:adenylate cyclase